MSSTVEIKTTNHHRSLHNRSRIPSTTENIRASIPILRLLKETSYHMGLQPPGTSIQCTVHEDNISTIQMVESEKTTYRTKHISTKVHHFKKYIRDKEVKVVHVPTHHQLAEIFTKAVVPHLFLFLRHKLI